MAEAAGPEPAGSDQAPPDSAGSTKAPTRPLAAGAAATGDRRELAAVVVAVAVGGGLGVLATAQPWSTVTVTRLAPLASIHHDVTGRTLQPAVTGLAVVALAGVLALLATRAYLRRAVGVVLVLAGLGMLWWALAGLAAVSDARGRTLVADARSGLDLGAASGTDVTVHPAWISVAALGGVLVVLSGVVTALRGGRWRAMSSRYESPSALAHGRTPATAAGNQGDPGHRRPDRLDPDLRDPDLGDPDLRDRDLGDPGHFDPGAAEVARARADVALWQQLDRGEDPTAIADDGDAIGTADPTNDYDPTNDFTATDDVGTTTDFPSAPSRDISRSDVER